MHVKKIRSKVVLSSSRIRRAIGTANVAVNGEPDVANKKTYAENEHKTHLCEYRCWKSVDKKRVKIMEKAAQINPEIEKKKVLSEL